MLLIWVYDEEYNIDINKDTPTLSFSEEEINKHNQKWTGLYKNMYVISFDNLTDDAITSLI